MDKKQLEAEKSEAFAEKLINIFNNGALSLMISIGHRTGLFNTMMNMPPSTSEQIATIANLNERYVREWLGAMVTGCIVEYNPDGELYFFPPEHSSWTTRAAGPSNMAVFAQYISMMGNVEDQIIECFKNGGGLHYNVFKRFHQIMEEDSRQTIVAQLFDYILPLVPGLVERLQSGINVLDVGCGSGGTLNLMAKTFPNSRFTGYDFSEEAIANAKAGADGPSNVKFEVKDVTTLDTDSEYDLILTFNTIHDLARPDKVLAIIAHALRHNGTYLMQDIAASSLLQNNMNHPTAPFMYAVSCIHCIPVSFAMKGMGLGAMWGEEKALEMLYQAGFTRVEVKKLPYDVFYSYYVVTK